MPNLTAQLIRTQNKLIVNPDANVVTVAWLAECFGVKKSVARKWLVKNGFQMRFIRQEENGNQLCAVLSRSEAVAAMKSRKAQGFRVEKL